MTDEPKTEPDYHGYNAYLEDLNRREMSNAETYDNALLTLSSALLGLSLTFTDDLVPLSRATALWLLYSSWGALTLTIVLTVGSFIYGQGVIRKLKKGAKKYFLEGKKEEQNKQSAALSARLYLLNTLTGVGFILGVALLGIYVGVNVNRESNMTDKDQTVHELLKKSQPVPSYDQAPQKQPEQQPQPAKQDDQQKK